ncbi:unnamed protein product [Blepharisma stoltei]|uniref:C2 NT-type domain-containing protein n=1 Tax=Blepharisma stoltei TaxID=1481888 RepID=A0AAU9IMW4_9CILI|nr:unnamed protein product [Blepharisma stoltei]
MAFLHKIGAEKVKYELNVSIHYVKAKLINKEKLKVIAKRGRGLEETQPMQYNAINSNVIFEYPLSFVITMHKKSEKYVRKIINFKLIELHGEKSVINGKAQFDFSELANNPGEKIERQEIQLKGCTDKSAVICVSMNLSHISRLRSQTDAVPILNNKAQESDLSLQKVQVNNAKQKFLTSQPRRATIHKGSEDEEDSFDILSQSTVITSSKEFDLLLDEASPPSGSNEAKKFISKDTNYIENSRYRSGSVPYSISQENSPQNNSQQNGKLTIDSKPVTEEKGLDFGEISPINIEEPKTRPKSNTIAHPNDYSESLTKGDLSSPKMKWLADFEIAQKKFVDPKDSHIDSEDSSSDEDPLDVSSDVYSTPPISFMAETQPNINSNERELEKREKQAGLSGPKRGATCAACKGCVLF